MNKKLLITISILIPILIISFFIKETNFIMRKNNQQSVVNQITVNRKDKKITLDLEEYLVGVVAAEMPALFEIEALKAQAVASRTYVINHFSTNTSITDTTDDQAYIDKSEMKEKWQDKYDEYYNKIKKAVESTKNEIITFKDKPIKAYYYSMSNGYTESSLNVFNEYTDYLNIIESPWDENNEKTITISKEDFCNKLKIECSNIVISNIKKDESNRIEYLNINNKQFTGIEIRKLLSLRSTDFEIKINKENVLITTKGYGHGVGMSQYGANNMAKEGYDYKEILNYYYQNTKIGKI